MGVGILARAYERQQYLKVLMRSYAGRNVRLDEPDLSKGIQTPPFPGLINKIENNIDALFGSWEPSARKRSVEWLGELLDFRPLDYTDVNRWFETLDLIEEIALTMPQNTLITCVFHSGGNLNEQILGVM